MGDCCTLRGSTGSVYDWKVGGPNPDPVCCCVIGENTQPTEAMFLRTQISELKSTSFVGFWPNPVRFWKDILLRKRCGLRWLLFQTRTHALGSCLLELWQSLFVTPIGVFRIITTFSASYWLHDGQEASLHVLVSWALPAIGFYCHTWFLMQS